MSGRPSPRTAARRVVRRARSETTATDRRESSRLGRLRASHSYGLVLGMVIGTFLFAAIAPDGTWATSVLVLFQCATLVCALWTSGVARISARPNATLLVLAVATAVVAVAPGGRIAEGAVLIFAGALTVAIAVVIGIGVVDQGEANLQSIRGAIAIYVLLGLLFVFLYSAVARIGTSAFFAQGTDGTRSLRVYFSYVTLCTIGYGDYTPSGTLGHTLAVVEALVGQLYLVTVVALLVARIGERRIRHAAADDTPLIPPG